MSRTLRAKILPPSGPSTYVPREDLFAEALGVRLTTVVAGPGYGKSTAVGAWADNVASCAWYTADSDDVSPARFSRGLADAVRRVVPALPIELGRPGAAPEETFVQDLSEALEGEVEEDLVLVVDDLHELGRRGPSLRLVEGLLRLAPPNVRIVVASRLAPPFSIERLRGHGQVLELEAEDLAFSLEEIEVLITGVLGEEAGRLASILFERTAGWPAAVRLSLELLRTLDPDEREYAIGTLARPGGGLYGYLAEEVFRHGPRDLRRLVEQLAPLERFTPELCDHLGVAHAAETLGRLKAQGIFLEPQSGPGGWFALHALVREVALQRARSTTSQVAEIHRRAAEWFELHGHFGEALRSFAAAADGDAIVRLLLEHELDVIDTGSFETVLEVAEQIPAGLRDPRVQQVVAQARMTRGDLGGALAGFERIAAGVDQLPAGLAWRLGTVHRMRGRTIDGLEVYRRANVEAATTLDEAMLLALTADALFELGDVETARALATRALEGALRLGEATPEAEAHLVLGALADRGAEPAGAEAHFAAALAAASRAGNVIASSSCRFHRALFLVRHGRPAEALTECAAAPRADVGLLYRRLLIVRALAWLDLGRLDAALSDFEAAHRLTEASGSNCVSGALLGVGEVQLRRGAVARARSAFEQELARAEQSGQVWTKSWALSGVARSIVSDDDQRASELVERAVALAPAELRASMLLTAGWITLWRGEAEGAREVAAEAAAVARRRDERGSLAEALELLALSTDDSDRQARMLEEALALWQQIGNELGEARVELALAVLSPEADDRTQRAAERRLQELGVRPGAAASVPGLLAALPRRDRAAVELRTLGAFRVLRAGHAVPTAEWQSRKARDLLKILVSRRGRAAPRELIMELLWPNEDPGPLPNRLSVALVALRRVLDPERRHPPDHYVAADADAVRLELANLEVDVESFLADAAAGLARVRAGRSDEAVELLRPAEEAYFGDFLEGDLYEDWSTPLRDEARSVYVAVVRALADHDATAGLHEAAMLHLLRLLEQDPYDEGAHLDLVRTLFAVGRHGEARQRYVTYVTRMDELGIEPETFPSRVALTR